VQRESQAQVSSTGSLPGEAARGKGDWEALSALPRWDTEQGTADLQCGGGV